MPKKHHQDHQQVNQERPHYQFLDQNLALKTNQRSQTHPGVMRLHKDLENMLKWLYKEMTLPMKANQKSQIPLDVMPHHKELVNMLRWQYKVTMILLTPQKFLLVYHPSMLENMLKWRCKAVTKEA